MTLIAHPNWLALEPSARTPVKLTIHALPHKNVWLKTQFHLEVLHAYALTELYQTTGDSVTGSPLSLNVTLTMIVRSRRSATKGLVLMHVS